MMIPSTSKLEDWASSLIIDFPDDNIPFLYNNQDWKKWGNMLILENSFSSNASPSTDTYHDWKAWAEAVFLTMANYA